MARTKNKKSLTLLQKITRRSFGALLMLFCGLVLLSCFFYHSSDNSLTAAGHGEIKNYLGFFGASAAEICLVWFGLALPVFLVAPLSWGYDIFRLRGFPHKYIRIFAFLSGTVFFAAFLGLLPQYFGVFQPGGNIGKFFARQFLTLFSNVYVYAYGKHILAAIFFILSLLAFDLAAGITFRNWFNAPAKSAAVPKSPSFGCGMLSKPSSTSAAVPTTKNPPASPKPKRRANAKNPNLKKTNRPKTKKPQPKKKPKNCRLTVPAPMIIINTPALIS